MILTLIVTTIAVYAIAFARSWFDDGYEPSSDYGQSMGALFDAAAMLVKFLVCSLVVLIMWLVYFIVT